MMCNKSHDVYLPEAAEDPVEDGRVYPPDEVARHAVRVLEVHGHGCEAAGPVVG